MISGELDKSILRIWDIDSESEINKFEPGFGSINSICCSSDGKYLFSGGYDKKIRRHNIEKI